MLIDKEQSIGHLKNEKILDMMNRIYDTIPHEHYSQIQKSSAN